MGLQHKAVPLNRTNSTVSTKGCKPRYTDDTMDFGEVVSSNHQGDP